jgi:hypothetical protein
LISGNQNVATRIQIWTHTTNHSKVSSAPGSCNARYLAVCIHRPATVIEDHNQPLVPIRRIVPNKMIAGSIWSAVGRAGGS